MAKKKHKKKHNFQHKNIPAAVSSGSKVVPTLSADSKTTSAPNEWSEVRGDVQKTLVLGGFFIMLMIGLWLVFEYTAIGPSVYNSLKL